MIKPTHLTATLIILSALAGCASMSQQSVAPPGWTAAANPVESYLDLISTYAIYAKTIWHDAGPLGGYWGDGVDPKANQNGAVRGTCSTMLGYATLAHALDRRMLPLDRVRRLQAAGLDREWLVRYVRADLRYVLAHHMSNPQPAQPTWGNSWQSPLWLSSAGVASLLVWNDLPEDLKFQLRQAAFAEADRVADKMPKDYRPGDTGAEENAWDLQAPVLALALSPDHPHADRWWHAARVYAVNVFSTPADRSSDARVGGDRVRDLVTTSNLFDDFTLENHGFFHPDYLQFSGEELGEAWATLTLGDQLNGTARAREFEPYAAHHMRDVWQRVMRSLFLPDGRLTFPSGTDWTMNCSVESSYLALIATTLDDPAARQIDRQHPLHALRHRDLSMASGRLLGDSNLEWWWEPLVVQRASTALLQHELRGGGGSKSRTSAPPPLSQLLPDAHIFVRHTDRYFVSASWGRKKTGTFTPFYRDYMKRPYMTVPIDAAILPADMDELESAKDVGDATVVSLRTASGGRAALICLPNSVLWLSASPLRSMGIQSDRLAGAHAIVSAASVTTVAPLEKRAPFDITGNWLNLDERFGVVAGTDHFRYTPAGGFNRKSVAVDQLQPHDAFAWQMIADASAAQTRLLAGEFAAHLDHGVATITLRDGPGGKKYRIVAPLTALASPAGTVNVVAAE